MSFEQVHQARQVGIVAIDADSEIVQDPPAVLPTLLSLETGRTAGQAPRPASSLVPLSAPRRFGRTAARFRRAATFDRVKRALDAIACPGSGLAATDLVLPVVTLARLRYTEYRRAPR
jgi:hypothetical protein